MKKDKQLQLVLEENLQALESAMDTFKYSIAKCEIIEYKIKYSYDELDSFEALTSRFARIADIITQKVLKTIFLLLREDVFTFLDRANLAEKLGIIPNAKDLIRIRDLRNEITHEYQLVNITDIYDSVLNNGKLLILLYNSINKFAKHKLSIR